MKQSGLGIAAFILSIVGLLLTCVLIGIVPCIVGLVLGIIALTKKDSKHGLAIAGIVISVIGIMFFILAMIGSKSTDNVTSSQVSVSAETEAVSTEERESSTEYVSQTESTISEERAESSAEVKEAVAESVDNSMNREQFISESEEISYKTLIRNPEDYIDKKIIITAKVQQIMQGGLFDSNQYYRVQTDNEGNEFYFDDEYFMYDFRPDDDMKILKDDVLVIYAEFAGMEEVKRALTKTKEEVPAIKAFYVELIKE